MITMIEYVHQQCKDKKVDTSIDFTMGNGNDTLFLSTISNHVFSFDIQEEALLHTKELIKDTRHITLIQDNHLYFDRYVDAFDLGIFNLGYLPGGNHQITTDSSTTIQTLQKALACLNQFGRIFLVVYIGHSRGKEESNAIESFVTSLDSKNYNVSKFMMMNKQNAPYVIEIEKRNANIQE